MSKLFVSNKDETPRMFENSFLEFFSKTHWTVPILVFLPIIAILLYIAISKLQSVLLVVSLFLAGLLIWSFVEYVLHRFVFHYHPKSDWGQKIHWTFHGVHHDYPQDSLRLVMPPSVSLPLGTVFYFLFQLVFAQYYTALLSGFFMGYLIYDISHFAIHHFAFTNKTLLAIKKHHMRHHYAQPDAGFGVSSPLWDLIFKTKFEDKEKVKH